MAKTYTIKHVIFALREEYQKIEKEFEDLKQYMSIGKNVDDYFFHITENPSKLFLIIYRKKNLLDKILVLLKSSPLFESYFTIEDIKDNYGSIKRQENCTITNKEKLNEKLDLIKESDYFINMFSKYIRCNENKKASLIIKHSSIDVSHGIELYPHLYYYSKSDTISMSNKDKIIKPDDLLNLLNLTINSDTLNDYINKILVNYEEKEIVIEDNFNKKYAKLDIIEEPKKLILVPKKK